LFAAAKNPPVGKKAESAARRRLSQFSILRPPHKYLRARGGVCNYYNNQSAEPRQRNYTLLISNMQSGACFLGCGLRLLYKQEAKAAAF